jgi:hypothetical protein
MRGKKTGGEDRIDGIYGEQFLTGLTRFTGLGRKGRKEEIRQEGHEMHEGGIFDVK